MALLALTAALPALAQGVALAGRMGQRGLFVIDGQTQMLGPGESARGVRVLKLDGDTATVDIGGRSVALAVGGAPVRLGAGAPDGAGMREVVIPAGPGGHFVVGGAINGRPVRFVVDTGATLVSMGTADAQRLGLDLQGGEHGLMQTANGAVPAVVVTLSSLRVGEVQLANVPAAVLPAAMPGILLGNSALSRFRMQRDGDVMRLTLR